jgi:hypothetical protein
MTTVKEVCYRLHICCRMPLRRKGSPATVDLFWMNDGVAEPDPFYTTIVLDVEDLTGDEEESIVTAVNFHRAFS